MKSKLRNAVILCLAIALLLVWGLPPSGLSAASTSKELQAAIRKQEDIAKQMDQLEKDQYQLAESRNQLSGELEWLNQRSEEQKQLVEEKTAQLQAALQAMDEAITAYAEAEAVLERKIVQYNQRLQVMFDHQSKSLFSVFLESKNLHGFFTTLQLMSIIADTDEQMLDDLEIARDDAQLKEELAKQQMIDMEAVVIQVEDELDQIRLDVSVRADDLQEVNHQLSEQEAAEDALAELSEQIGSEIFALQQKLAAERAAAATRAAQATAAAQATRAAEAAAAEATRAAEAAAAEAAGRESEAPANTPEDPAEQPAGNVPNAQGWVWPVPSSQSISSYYGNRRHPIYGSVRFHAGIDISAAYGQPVVASRPGTVLILVNPREGSNTGGYGYGNYIVIDHGDGFSSLYAHLKNTKVSVGQEVASGQLIGTIGSTGTSTGPHLHFEIRLNGSTKNPLDYLR